MREVLIGSIGNGVYVLVSDVTKFDANVKPSVQNYPVLLFARKIEYDISCDLILPLVFRLLFFDMILLSLLVFLLLFIDFFSLRLQLICLSCWFLRYDSLFHMRILLVRCRSLYGV